MESRSRNVGAKHVLRFLGSIHSSQTLFDDVSIFIVWAIGAFWSFRRKLGKQIEVFVCILQPSPTPPDVGCCQGFQTCCRFGGLGFDFRVSWIHAMAKTNNLWWTHETLLALLAQKTFGAKPKPRKMFAQNIALKNFSINARNALSVSNQQIQMHRPIRFEHQDGPNTILWNIWHPYWCFQVWVMKAGNPFPTCLFGETHRHPPNIATNRQEFRVFGVFEGKKGKTPFSGEKKGKNTKNSKFWIFSKNGQFGPLFSPKSFPGSSPVLARFLPGSCPVLARFLPGSPRFCPVLVKFFWDFSFFFGFFVRFWLGPEKITKNSEIFDRKEKKSAKLRNFRSECERSQNSESCTNFSGPGQQNPENSCP